MSDSTVSPSGSFRMDNPSTRAAQFAADDPPLGSRIARVRSLFVGFS